MWSYISLGIILLLFFKFLSKPILVILDKKISDEQSLVLDAEQTLRQSEEQLRYAKEILEEKRFKSEKLVAELKNDSRAKIEKAQKQMQLDKSRALAEFDEDYNQKISDIVDEIQKSFVISSFNSTLHEIKNQALLNQQINSYFKKYITVKT